MAGTDLEAIKLANENLTQEFYKLSEKLYSATNVANAQADANAQTEQSSSDNVYDADYKVESDDNK